MPTKYPAIVTPECKWCGKIFEYYAKDRRWRKRFKYCSDQCKDNCKKAWKRGGSHIDGPLIGKININLPIVPVVVPASYEQYQEDKRLEKESRDKAAAKINAEYWIALRRSKGIGIQCLADTDG